LNCLTSAKLRIKLQVMRNTRSSRKSWINARIKTKAMKSPSYFKRSITNGQGNC
jgi:hypothetical protein